MISWYSTVFVCIEALVKPVQVEVHCACTALLFCEQLHNIPFSRDPTELTQGVMLYFRSMFFNMQNSSLPEHTSVQQFILGPYIIIAFMAHIFLLWTEYMSVVSMQSADNLLLLFPHFELWHFQA